LNTNNRLDERPLLNNNNDGNNNSRVLTVMSNITLIFA